MSGAKVQGAVNGHGVIGKRVADAVALQDDMELVGEAAVASDYRVRVAVERSHAVFAADPAASHEMDVADTQVARIWQAGEKQELAGYSCCTQVNPTRALDRGFAGVVSCNTTCDAHVAASLLSTICGSPHDRCRPALGTGWRASCRLA